MFDLNLISLHLEQGHETNTLPGFYVAPVPRHLARGRSGDQLFFLITFQNFSHFSAAETQQLFDRLGQVYYQIPGTVTSALRDTAEVLSQELLNHNMKAGKPGSQGLALLNLAAIHNNQLYLAHCGPTHSFLVSSKVFEHFTDQQLAGRGLGLSRAVSIRYYQANLEAGTSLIFCVEPPLIWTDSLLTSSLSLSADALKHQLISQVHPKFNAVVVQLQEGNGKVTLEGRPWSVAQKGTPSPHSEMPPTAKPLAPKPAVETAVTGIKSAADAIAQIKQQLPQKAPSQPAASASQPAASAAPASPVEAKPAVLTASPAAAGAPNARPSEKTTAPTARANPLPAKVTKPPVRAPEIQEVQREKEKPSFWASFSPIWQQFRQAWGSFEQAVHDFFIRLLPAKDEKEARLSPGVMIFIAIAVPIIVSAVGLGVYIQKGQNAQYATYFDQAQAIASQASKESNAKMARNDWSSALILLDKADAYKTTTESSTLRQKAQNAVDGYDGVDRLSFQSALADRLANSVKITRILSDSNDLYLLDATSGSVIRSTLSSNGYKVDTNFQCGPGTYGALTVTALVDMLVMPINNSWGASIAAIDKSGDIIFCIPNNKPQANDSALLPPATHWGNLISFTLLDNELYVLDTSSNIGVYSVTTDKDKSDQITGFDSKVSEFFSSVPKLSDVVNMIINSQDVYLLHNDGHLTHCTYSAAGVQATTCTDPVNFGDSRAAYEPNPTDFPGTRFTQIQYTDPPFPSIGILDTSTNAVYQFSLRLNLQRLMQPQSTLSTAQGSATAFFMSPQQTLFMAFGNLVYYTNIP